MSKKKKYSEIIKEKIDLLEIGGSLNRKDFVIELWGDYDYFLNGSFSVHFGKAKRLMPNKKFATIKGLITRLS